MRKLSGIGQVHYVSLGHVVYLSLKQKPTLQQLQIDIPKPLVYTS